jgi:hypothetical protein
MQVKNCLGLLVAVAALVAVAFGQAPLPQPPAGFTALPMGAAQQAMRDAGASDGVQAEKPNASFPKCYPDPKVNFSYGWSVVGSQANVDLMLKMPEDKATDIAGDRNEPDGKNSYRGGVLFWRKETMTMVAVEGHCPDKVVFYHGNWTGFVSGKLITVSVANLYQSKEAGQGWIDDYISRMSKVVAALP